jgi:nicotinamidase-related amidase
MHMDLKTKIDPAHTALLVIDVQKDFASPEGLLGRGGRDLSQVEIMIDKLEKTIEVAKRAGVLTLYMKQVYDRSKLNQLQLEQYDLDGKLATCDRATDGHEFYRLNPPREVVFEKYDYNAFSNPKLVKVLQAHNVKTLIVAGMDSYYCVETAIRNGFDLGYKIVLPTDLVAGNGRHLDMQERTFRLTEKTFGVLTTSEELEKIWS